MYVGAFPWLQRRTDRVAHGDGMVLELLCYILCYVFWGWPLLSDDYLFMCGLMPWILYDMLWVSLRSCLCVLMYNIISFYLTNSFCEELNFGHVTKSLLQGILSPRVLQLMRSNARYSKPFKYTCLCVEITWTWGTKGSYPWNVKPGLFTWQFSFGLVLNWIELLALPFLPHAYVWHCMCEPWPKSSSMLGATWLDSSPFQLLFLVFIRVVSLVRFRIVSLASLDCSLCVWNHFQSILVHAGPSAWILRSSWLP